MSLSDIRYTVLQTVNEVQRKLSLTQTTLNANAFSIKCIDFINDIMADISDFGDWQETIATAKVTAVSGQRDYQVQTSAVIKNIGDIFIENRRGPLRAVSIQQMRILTRTTSMGTPTQFCIFGTDSNGNPNIRVRPTPDASADGQLISVLYYTKPPIYTTANASTIIPFPARLVVTGTLAKALLDESSGEPTPQYQTYYQDYLSLRKEALNRYNSDTGWDVQFSPGRVSRYNK